MTRFDFTNKVALVTGSSRGIGAEILTQLVQSGAQGVLHYWADPDGANQREAEELAQRLSPSGRVLCIAADVRDPQSVEAMFQQVKSQFGGLDVLVNNAGILKDRGIRKMTIDDWNAVISTNLSGVFHCCKSAAEVLREGGRIVNIASVAGLVGIPGQANYAAAKAGVIGLTRSLAKELARRGITVNAVAPGVIQTTMIQDMKPEVLDSYIQQIPMGRIGLPQDVAHAVLFLASEESSYITGQVLPITGGWLI